MIILWLSWLLYAIILQHQNKLIHEQYGVLEKKKAYLAVLMHVTINNRVHYGPTT